MFVIVYSTFSFDLLVLCFFFLPICNLGEPSNKMIIRCSPKWLHEYYSLLPAEGEIVDKWIFGNIFRCQQTCMAGYLFEHLPDNREIFVLNDNRIEMGWKMCSWYSEWRKSRLTSNQPKGNTLPLGIEFSSELKKLSYQEINQPVLSSRFFK